jgi:hypothetical protein
MKRIIQIQLFLFMLLSCAAFAQGGQKGRDTSQTSTGAERVQAMKVAFITKRLNLTPAEAEKFWPIYNEYQDKRDAVRKQQQEIRKKIREQGDTLPEAELTRLADEEMALRQQDLALQLEMHNKLKAVLPPKKLAQLYVAEEDFKKELLRILTEEKETKKPKQR